MISHEFAFFNGSYGGATHLFCLCLDRGFLDLPLAAVGGCWAGVGAWSADAAVTPEDVEATGGAAAPVTSLPSSPAVGGSRDPLVLGGEHAACAGIGSSMALFSSSDLGGTSGLAHTALAAAATDASSSAFLSSCSFKSGVNSFARFFS